MNQSLGYRTEVALGIYQALKVGGVDFAVYLPDSLLDPIEQLLEDDPSVQTVVCAREDEGVAIAMGAYLGGRLPVVLMEGSGLGMSGLALARGLLMRTPMLIVAAHSRALGGKFDYHAATRMVGESTLAGLGIPAVVLDDAAQAPTIVREALLTVRGQRVPVGLFVPRHVIRAD